MKKAVTEKDCAEFAERFNAPDFDRYNLSPRDREILHSAEFSAFSGVEKKGWGGRVGEGEPKRLEALETAVETHGGRRPASPHILIGIPKSLVKSTLWRQLGPGPRDLLQYLLSRSNTRTFKDVYPGRDTIMNDLGLDVRTLRRYEQILENSKLIKIIQPGERDEFGQRYRSRRFKFTLVKYINADRREYNEKHGGEFYQPIRDMHALWSEVERMAKELQFDASQIKRRDEVVHMALDELAKRLQIDSVDHLGRVHIILHSRIYKPELAHPVLPDNVLLFPDKKNKDIIINPSETWKGFERKLNKALSDAEKRRKTQPLIALFSTIEKAESKAI